MVEGRFLSPMGAGHPVVLQNKIAKPNHAMATTKILHKRFSWRPSDHRSANAPQAWPAAPIRLLLWRRVDRYPFSAGCGGCIQSICAANRTVDNFLEPQVVPGLDRRRQGG